MIAIVLSCFTVDDGKNRVIHLEGFESAGASACGEAESTGSDGAGPKRSLPRTTAEGIPEVRKMPWCPVVLLILALAGPAAAAEATFVTPDQLDLTKLVAPASAPDSAQQKRDLADVLSVQKARTSTQAERVLADATAGTFGFADVLGPNFNAERVP